MRGIRQGCPISALLLILVVEIMAVSLRSDNDIHCCTINDEQFKLSQYADDGTLILSDIESINLSLAGIKTFSKLSGLNLNLHKCEGIWLSQNPNNIPEYKGIHFTTKPVRCLGIYIGRNKKECERLNWENKLVFLRIYLIDRRKDI